MPKAARIRHAHHSSAKLPIKSVNDDLPSLEFLKSSDERVAVENSQPIPAADNLNQRTKKAKQLEKRQAFLQKLEPSTKQLSKSTTRRMKRKAREQLTGDLNDLQKAIATLEEEAVVEDDSLATIANADSSEQTTSKPSTIPGLIGKGVSSTLSKSQRKRALELERLRHPLILSNSEYSSNPFKTIRTHAENTLLKHDSTLP